MNILALDTSTEYLSVALRYGGRVLSRHFHAGQGHSQRILPTIRELLDEAGADIGDLHAIVFGAGPGSFTGLRIGCGVAQGLAFGAGLPVLGVCTLNAMAQASGHARVIACLDARMGEIYHAVYERRGTDWHIVMPPALHKPDRLPMIEGDGWAGVGNGWAVYADALQNRYGHQVDVMLPEQYPEALAMLALAEPRLTAGEGVPAEQALPVYIRNRVALKTHERESGLKL
ncbi:MAG TPA: tRNA (adenosine(37)-N6)-threonylcarbamoyltransferase complex dimerization subunit type 1 TsaB [Methylophilaceae bacterium]|jgi:tRNA threonylcarbamoyladenosine biosynthesis protein TsaB